MSGNETASADRKLVLRLLVLAILTFPLISFASDEDGRYASLTVEGLLGVGLDVEAPPSGLTLPGRGFVLGLAANLDMLGGSLNVSEVPTNLVRNLNVRGGSAAPSGGSGRFYAYVITAFVDGNEYLQRYDYLRLGEGNESWGITFEWQADPRLCDLTRIGARTGYRIYRELIPGNTSGVISDPDSQSLERIAEIPLDTGSGDIRVVDEGVAALGGYPTYSASGNLEVSNHASVDALRVGSTSVPGSGSARLQSSLYVGKSASISGSVGIRTAPVTAACLSIADSSRANIYLDATQGPLGKNWELASTGLGGFEITDSLGAGVFCVGGSPQLSITSTGVVGIGLAPAGPAPSGSLEVAHALGVGTAVPAAAGCGDVRVAGTLFTQWIAPLVAGRLININGGIATTADVVVGGVLCGLGGDPVSICAAKLSGDLELVGKMITQRIEALNQGQLMQLDGGITITKDLVLGGTLAGLAGAPVTINAARVLADLTVEGTVIAQRIEALNQGQLMQLDGGITITKDLVLGGTLAGLAGAPVEINAVKIMADATVDGAVTTQRIRALNPGQLMQLDGGITITKDLVLGGTLAGLAGAPVTTNAADIATDLTVGRDVSVLNDLVVANNADILNDLFVLNDATVIGDLTVTGIKFFAQQHPGDPTKVVTYAALEGPEAGTYVRGTTRLVDGEAVIELPESFRLVTSDAGLTAQVTLLEDCNGLYVSEKSTTRIVVKELLEGTSNARFDYLVQGVRRGYEDFDPIRAGARSES